MPGYDRICSDFCVKLNTVYQQLERIWIDIGICEEQRQDRSDTVVTHLTNLLDEIIAEEEELHKSLTASIAESKEVLASLCRELELPTIQVSDEVTVLQKDKELRQHIKKLRKEKQERMKEIQLLQREDQSLCDALCTTPYYVPSNTVPTGKQLSELRQHVMSSKVEKEKRSERFATVRKQIIDLMKELEKDPDNSFENDVVSENNSSFVLSAKNMNLLEGLHKQLEIMKRDAEKTYRDLLDKIVTLWDRLEVAQEDRQAFCANNIGHTHKTITSLRSELLRCEQLKMMNIENFVEGMRRELVVWWDMCFYSSDQRAAFTPYNEREYTEELLEQHECEVQRLKDVYREAEELYKKVHRRQTVFQSIKDFEKSKTSDDPNRFNNRGGRLNQLLKVNQKMKKELPTIEKDLKQSVAVWEAKHEKPFLIAGLQYGEYIRKEWADWDEAQQEEKRIRQLQKAKITEQEMTFGSKPCTPVKRRLCVTGTPTKQPNSKIRKLQHTPTLTPRNQLTSTFSSHFGLPSHGKTPTSLSKETPKVRRSRRLASARRNLTNLSHMSHSSILSDGSAPPNMSLASAGSYRDFANGLHVKSQNIANINTEMGLDKKARPTQQNRTGQFRV